MYVKHQQSELFQRPYAIQIKFLGCFENYSKFIITLKLKTELYLISHTHRIHTSKPSRHSFVLKKITCVVKGSFWNSLKMWYWSSAQCPGYRVWFAHLWQISSQGCKTICFCHQGVKEAVFFLCCWEQFFPP